ncbi:hypothetical protein [Leptothoe kymatousa]|uniref:hypothetical protein n=1 Tax=Leptothoe kymatousa TaxID=2651727 RepID=UPI001C00B64A|nr:hypothetical protein [Leptothoe kymatousa]
MLPMTLGRTLSACSLVLFLGGCTSLTAADQDSVANPDALPAAADQDSVANPDALPAGADPNLATVEVEFVEGAPKDRFVIQNTGACGLEDLTVALDLSSSAGGLIFDTSATGAGVEVFQPFEVEEGDIAQLVANRVEDGDTELALRIATLGAGDRASFTIDVDDTLPQGELGQIRVADSEISGARVTITAGDSAVTAAEFSNGSIARAQLSPCPSA